MITKRTNTSVRLAQRKQLTVGAYQNMVGSNELGRELAAGSIIGGVFRILRSIGEGGMGVVYLAQHQGLGRKYAVKVLSPEAINEQNWLRFQSEAKILAMLNHPTVVQVYDLGLHDKTIPYYSMDYLDGSTLEEQLAKKGPLPLGFTIDVFLELLDGLAYAHQRQIIHRDIKPANIFICTAGTASQRAGVMKPEVKILDFGISKLLGANSHMQNLTAIGEIFGSPFYMSPEQCRGDKVDLRSDIYSVGCSLFEALSGFVPFEGPTSLDISMMHEEAEPPRLVDVVDSDLAKTLPDSINTVITNCLAKHPDDRYQSVAEVARDLTRVRQGKSVELLSRSTASEQSMVKKKKLAKTSYSLPLLLALAVAVVILGCAGLSLYFAAKPKAHSVNPESNVDLNSDLNADSGAPSLASKVNLRNDLSLPSLYVDADVDVEGETDIDSPENAKLIKAFLASEPGFFSKPVAGPGGKGRIYSFPKTFSLGEVTFADKSRRDVSRRAKGDVMVPAGCAVRFSTGEAIKSYPDLLKYFRADDLHTIFVDDAKPVSRRLLPNIARLTSLQHVGFARSSLEEKDLEDLGLLPNLASLDLRRCHISGEVLAKQKIMTTLRAIRIEGVKDISPVLQALVEAKKIEVLFLGDNSLSAADISSILALPDIRDLSLVNCTITNDDLVRLTALKKIRRLNFDQCSRLDKTCLDTLAKFKNLEILIVPDALLNDQSEQYLKQRLPNLRQVR